VDEAQFQRALWNVLIVGSVVIGIGATALFFVFRRFGKTGAGGQRHVLFIAALLAFVFTMSLIFFLLSRR
jgi:hypothetical protein